MLIPGTAMSSCVVWLFGGNYNTAIATMKQRLFCDYNIPYPHSHENEIWKKNKKHRDIYTQKQKLWSITLW